MVQSKKPKSADIINPGLGDIEKVRDILFGKYVADFKQRFDELEQRLEADVDKLKERLTDKMDKMDEMINESMGRLDQRIAEEQRNRDAELQALQSNLGEAETKLQHAISLMEDETGQGLESIREMIAATKAELSDAANQQREKLEQDKVGRQALARMLDEVALKLRGED